MSVRVSRATPVCHRPLADRNRTFPDSAIPTDCARSTIEQLHAPRYAATDGNEQLRSLLRTSLLTEYGNAE
jgi:hypothetical protein